MVEKNTHQGDNCAQENGLTKKHCDAKATPKAGPVEDENDSTGCLETQSDADFEESLRNFELRLNEYAETNNTRNQGLILS
mmetsp:Transcript_3610/g.2357  ORF Transcript_3610/g.2357 Transcript_3610/m.2357 type:complete len:81 (+) Transcript_3610:1313-1555(+)|eukprot:CAMPEP_0116886614 /NCGR_PEP_ID=MMETSP0463-20121206/20553_1 /TAXON_ID=181622 /ORGANISM="Strombidinopsis sp, Strain SopsisLIS2011" /LENGTH=80 /DNA_ID=CAMNT_0004547389 /DNA_START=1289 /DNA_END=1531 /DNA_ORIENTATION=+